MHPIVYHIASGEVLFTGALTLVVATLLPHRWRWSGYLRRWLVALGGVAVTLASAALPWWVYAFAAITTIGWLVARPDWRYAAFLRWGTAIGWLAVMGWELPYHWPVTAVAPRATQLTVIGDSVSAGMGGSDPAETWPQLLASRRQLVVQDLSHVGETAGSALKRAAQSGIDAPLVLVEIGGNDVLGSTSAAQFRSDLASLLALLTANNRQVVMLELPLPPLCHGYSAAQRELARKYGVRLIPRRVFLSVLADPDCTVDSIHLSARGHERMAEAVEQVLLSPAASQSAETGSR